MSVSPPLNEVKPDLLFGMNRESALGLFDLSVCQSLASSLSKAALLHSTLDCFNKIRQIVIGCTKSGDLSDIINLAGFKARFQTNKILQRGMTSQDAQPIEALDAAGIPNTR